MVKVYTEESISENFIESHPSCKRATTFNRSAGAHLQAFILRRVCSLLTFPQRVMGPSPEITADASCISLTSQCRSTPVTHGLRAQAVLEYVRWRRWDPHLCWVKYFQCVSSGDTHNPTGKEISHVLEVSPNATVCSWDLTRS